jgi:hypothetical protein
MRKPPRLLLALVTLMLAASACGGLSKNGPKGGGDDSPYPTGSNRLVLRVDSCCGFVAYEYTLRQIPTFSLFGDGRSMTQGPQIEIYPGPALSNVQQSVITDEGIRRILEAARTAGLYESHNYTEPMTVSDQATTIFTLVEADGTRHVTRAYALTESNDDGIPQPQREARHKLRHFMNQIGSLRDWLPQGSVGDDQEAPVEGLRVFSRELTPRDVDADLKQQVKDWPLDEALDTFGAPVEGQQGLRCGVVQGNDLSRLLPEVRESNELTPWRSGDTKYRLIVRPLLPDESGC